MTASGREHEMGAPRRFGYGLPGAGVAVETDDPTLRKWLDEFLRPAYDPLPPGVDGPTVVVSSDRSPSVFPPPEGSTVVGVQPCFALDREVAGHRAWRSGDVIVVSDERYGTQYCVGPQAVHIVREDSSVRSRASVMRVVRELTTAQALADGTRMQLHGAALGRDGPIVVLAGPKHAGKTTLTTRLASVGDLAIAGNDRMLIAPGAGSRPWSVRPIPTVVSVRPGTRAQLEGRFDDFPDVPSPAHLTLAELDAISERTPARAPDGRLKLSPAQFARAAGVSSCGEGTLAAVLLISVDPALDRYALESCAPDRARTGLDAVRYGSRRDGTPRTLFEEWLGTTRPADADDLLLDELVRRVPVSTLRVGSRVMHDDDVAADLVAEVLVGA